MPAEFLPVAAQHSELMESLTSWVLRRALSDYTAWTAAGHDWTVAVNVSAPDLGSLEFAGNVGQILQEAGVRPDRLHLEVTETELTFDTPLAGRVVGALAAQGILMSIDDFGIGNTSMSQLHTLKVSEVKIDRTFLAALPGNEQDRAKVRSLIDLGHSLGCLVTAEGVEWRDVADWLVDAGCDHAQGYLWLRPRSWPEIAQVFGATTSATAAAAVATESAPAQTVRQEPESIELNRPTADGARKAEPVRLGVGGWVAQRSAIESLPTAVRGAARGDTHLPALLTQVLVSLSEPGSTSTPEADAVALLTARELDVLRCLIEGLPRIEIGPLLYISPHTVRTHIQSILFKLNVHSSLTAVAFARRAGVIGLQEDVNPANDVHRSIQRRGSSVMSS